MRWTSGFFHSSRFLFSRKESKIIRKERNTKDRRAPRALFPHRCQKSPGVHRHFFIFLAFWHELRAPAAASRILFSHCFGGLHKCEPRPRPVSSSIQSLSRSSLSRVAVPVCAASTPVLHPSAQQQQQQQRAPSRLHICARRRKAHLRASVVRRTTQKKKLKTYRHTIAFLSAQR